MKENLGNAVVLVQILEEEEGEIVRIMVEVEVLDIDNIQGIYAQLGLEVSHYSAYNFS